MYERTHVLDALVLKVSLFDNDVIVFRYLRSISGAGA